MSRPTSFQPFAAAGAMRNLPAALMLLLLRGYKLLLSPLFPGACRYLPSCSEYAAIAIREHGALKGAWLAAKRISRCHPFGGSGLDPVPVPVRSSTGEPDEN
jgi:putative membrane protein insertion efficiency factor